MTRQDILDHLRTEAPALRLRFGLKTLAVFGSMARGDPLTLRAAGGFGRRICRFPEISYLVC